MKQDYKLLRIWGRNMGSPASYSEEQAAIARKAGAPQTAMHYNTKEQESRSRKRDPRRTTWTDPKTGDVWSLYDEYLPTGARHNMNNAAEHLYHQSLSDILKEIGFEERDRVYADVLAQVTMEVNVDAWMAQHGVDRPTALDQIRADITDWIKDAFNTYPKWDNLIDGAVDVKVAMEA